MANNTENIKKMLEQLNSDRDQTGDAVFIVDPQQIRAHRNILAALSPKFKAQFYGPSPDHGEIRIPNVSAAAFQEFLQFFYKESVNLTMDNIASVLDLAQQSLAEGFTNICVDFLKKSITTGNVCSVYRLAILYDIESLRSDCEQQISSKTMYVMASDDFLQCDRDVLQHILNLDALSCPEKDVFNSCIEWARADCKQKSLDETKAENLRSALGDAIHLVRFASISAHEFATFVHRLNSFFPADELVDLISITARVKDFSSLKFNQSTRIQPKDSLEAVVGTITWSLECDRFVKRVINDGGQTDEKLESKIRCDKPIRLYGFALGFNLNENGLNMSKNWKSIVIFVGRDNGPLDKISQKSTMYQAKLETIFIFEDPIDSLIAFETFFPVDRLQANHKPVVKDRIVVDDNEFTCSGELVTRLFFDNL